MENQLQESPINDPDNKDYYTYKGKKSNDIAFGIAAGLAYAILCAYFITFIRYEILIALYVLAIVIIVILKRHYIALGMVLIITVPLAIVGGCMALIR